MAVWWEPLGAAPRRPICPDDACPGDPAGRSMTGRPPGAPGATIIGGTGRAPVHARVWPDPLVGVLGWSDRARRESLGAGPRRPICLDGAHSRDPVGRSMTCGSCAHLGLPSLGGAHPLTPTHESLAGPTCRVLGLVRSRQAGVRCSGLFGRYSQAVRCDCLRRFHWAC